jgi:hypothetical protein
VAAALIEGTNDPFVVRMHEKVYVAEGPLLDGVNEELESYALKPADVSSFGALAGVALPSVLEPVHCDADAPGCGGFDIEELVETGAALDERAGDSGDGERVKPPDELSDDWAGRAMSGVLVPFERSDQVGEGGEVGAAFLVDERDVA